MEKKVLTGQSLFDIAIQECGTVEEAFAIALANDVSISAELTAGTKLNPGQSVDVRVTDYYRVRNLKPATFTADGVLDFSGIGYMSIEENFVVS